MNVLRSPQTKDEFAKYYNLRWQILREPWQQALGSEQDEIEQQAIHRMIINDQEQVLAVGRLEKITQHKAKIRYMAVSHKAQGQGLGKQIIAELELQAQLYGITEIILNSRENAVSFYEQLCYKNEGFSHLLFNEVKHYQMVKKLQKHPKHQNIDTQKLQEIWHKTIPLSKAMDIEISYFDQLQLVTQCDVDFNKNLHHTMFAGSIYTLATLTGWAWVYLQMQQREINGDIVLADANIRYHAPLKGVAHAKVSINDVTGELSTSNVNKKSRIKLSVNVYCGEQICATFSGTYFVITNK